MQRMMKITSSMILSSESAYDLEEQVHEYMADGWQPFGGVAVADKHDIHAHPYYAQALVKYADPNLLKQAELQRAHTKRG